MKNDEQVHPFAIVPAEVVMDTRLTLETMRVLVTLFSFRNKVTGLTFPSREAISERCGMHPSNISEATKKLVDLGWLSKDGKGGYSKTTKYTITIPEEVSEMAEKHKARSDARKAKVAEQTTVAQSATVAEQATRKGSPVGYSSVAEQATRKGSPVGYTQVTDHLTDQLTDKKATELSAPKKSGAPKEKSEAVTNEAWAAYNTAYFNRYGTEMIETGKTRGQMMTFLKRVGREEAPHIAAFYVSLNNKYYVQNQHTLGALVSDAEALRTQWITGRTMTSRRASEIDDTATNVNAVNEAIAMLRRREKNAAL